MDSIKLDIIGMNCANCAIKIENEVGVLAGVTEARVNIINEDLIINIENSADKEGIVNEAKRIVLSHEPHVKFTKDNDNLLLKKDNSKDMDINQSDVGNDKKKSFSIFDKIKENSELLKIITALILFIISFKVEGNITNILLFMAYIISGYEIVKTALFNLIKGKVFDENFLMTLATLGAFLIGEYKEAVGVMLFYMIGEFFQDMAVDKSRKSIKDLINIRPVFANLKKGNEILKIHPSKVMVGDTLVINPGDRIPVDSKVIKGGTSLDQMALTGESIPKGVIIGDTILSGAVNLSSTIEVKAIKEYKNSTVSKIMDLVENASSKKAEGEKFITKFARYYTPIVVLLAFIVAFIVPLLIGEDFTTWIKKALIFLVISCPCALVLSIPLGFFGGVGLASRNGILVKGANYLELLKNIDTVILDKTGTITKGEFSISKINEVNKDNEYSILDYAYLGEVNSPHPIAKSIVSTYKGGANRGLINDSKEVKGKGTITSLNNGTIIYTGNKKLLEEVDITVNEEDSTSVHIGIFKDNKALYLGNIKVEDTLKEDSIKAIEELNKASIKTIMLSGDDKNIVSKVAKSVNIGEYYGNLLPQDKVKMVEDIKNRTNKPVAFCGDGLNDTPVLKLSDVGISMGQIGSEAAIEASDVVITKDSLLKIPKAIKISKITNQIVMQNIIVALGVKILVMIQSIFFTENVWLAIFADVGVALIAILNAARLSYMKI